MNASDRIFRDNQKTLAEFCKTIWPIIENALRDWHRYLPWNNLMTRSIPGVITEGSQRRSRCSTPKDQARRVAPFSNRLRGRLSTLRLRR
ncbi:MAG: hypothetical protein KTR25_20910 [Myxococcales bacterium]|nr:hypothetical protein [Myxococcales bacterium]